MKKKNPIATKKRTGNTFSVQSSLQPSKKPVIFSNWAVCDPDKVIRKQ